MVEYELEIEMKSPETQIVGIYECPVSKTRIEQSLKATDDVPPEAIPCALHGGEHQAVLVEIENRIVTGKEGTMKERANL